MSGRHKAKKIEKHYARRVGKKTKLSDYPDVREEEVVFPEDIYVAYAVCSRDCGRSEFIVDGSTQICHYCGKVMFRIVSRKYCLVPAEESSMS